MKQQRHVILSVNRNLCRGRKHDMNDETSGRNRYLWLGFSYTKKIGKGMISVSNLPWTTHYQKVWRRKFTFFIQCFNICQINSNIVHFIHRIWISCIECLVVFANHKLGNKKYPRRNATGKICGSLSSDNIATRTDGRLQGFAFSTFWRSWASQDD